MSKKSNAPTTADSQKPAKHHMNAERAAKHARRLNKASSQGAQPPAPAGVNQVEEIHKVRLNTQGDDIIRRKAGSGTRVEQQKVADQSSYSQLSHALVQKTGSSFFVQKHTFVKASVTKRGTHLNKPSGDAAQHSAAASGIVLGNMKQGGHIRQIKDLGSNPGSRVGSTKAPQRCGDQTTIIKKQ